MAKRKWLFIAAVLSLLLLLAGGAAWFYLWVQSGVVRQKLVDSLRDDLNNVDVEVGSVWWLPWGSIHVNDLRLTRKDDPTHKPFLIVPQARIYPDKEQFTEGRLVIRKVEFNSPEFRLERRRDGTWNFADILRSDKPADTRPLPLFQMKDATVSIIDAASGSEPIAQFQHIQASVINDPFTVFKFDVEGDGRLVGGFSLKGKYHRQNGLTGTADLSRLVISEELVSLVGRYKPDTEEYIRKLRGIATVHLDLTLPSRDAMTYDLQVGFREGRWEYPDLPTSLENIRFDARFNNGDLKIDGLSAQAGTAKLSLSVDLAKESICAPVGVRLSVPSRAPPKDTPAPEHAPFQEIEDRLRKLEISLDHLTLTPELFQHLPPRVKLIDNMFAPSGPVNIRYSYQRSEGNWNKKFVAEPLGMAGTYRGFPYPLKGIRGKLTYTVGSLPETAHDRIDIALTAEGAGTTVDITGTVQGTAPDMNVDLRISGKGITLDQTLIAALPDENPKLIERLHGTAYGDFVAEIRHNERIRREHGPEVFDNLFTIRIKNGSINYEEFPYALENLAGTLIIRTVPNRPSQLPATQGIAGPKPGGDLGVLEFRDFRATHHGAVIRGSGQKDPVPGGTLFDLNLQGENVELDRDIHKALSALRLDSIWAGLGPSGRMNCNVRVRLMDRVGQGSGFNPVDDLEMSMGFAGATIQPDFFAYQLKNVAGAFRYSQGKLDLEKFSGNHGAMRISLPKSEVLFRPSGGYWADLRDVQISPLILDSDFMKALPPGLRSACAGLEWKGPLKLHANRIVIDEQPGPFVPRQLPGPRVVQARGQKPMEQLRNELVTPGVQIPLKPGPATVRAGTPPNEPLPVLPTIYWDGSIVMDGASLRTGVAWEDIHGKFACWGVYQGDHLGAVRGNLEMDKVALAKQPFENIRAKFWVDPKQPNVLQMDSVTGRLFGGELGGQGWVVMQSPVRYAINLHGARIKLSDIARHYQLGPKVQLEGLASAQLYLSNKLDERTGMLVLEGGGTIDVPNGKILNLPLLLDLIKVARLRKPDQTGFEEAHILFALRGNRIKFGQLDLIGNAISLGGEGEMNTDGTGVQLEFYPVWTKVKEIFALPGDISAEVSKRLLKINVTGRLDGKLNYESEPIPAIVDPLKRVMDRMKQ